MEKLAPLDPVQLKICAWSGPAFVVLMAAAYLLTGMLPPPGPTEEAAAVAQFYSDNSIGIRIGMVLMLFGSAIFPYFMAGVIEQMKRMNNPSPLMIQVVVLFCGGLTLGLFIMAALWATAAFRPDTLPEIIQLINDFAFILFLWPGTFTPISYIAIAIAILADKGPERVFPRWFAFYNLWSAMLALVSCTIVFFKTGPFAFDGFYCFWVNMAVFFLWYVVMAVVLLRSTKRTKESPLGYAPLAST